MRDVSHEIGKEIESKYIALVDRAVRWAWEDGYVAGMNDERRLNAVD